MTSKIGASNGGHTIKVLNTQSINVNNKNNGNGFGSHLHHHHHVHHVHHVHYQEPYELSQDLVAKQLELLEKKYGGTKKAKVAALTIQRAFRRSVLIFLISSYTYTFKRRHILFFII